MLELDSGVEQGDDDVALAGGDAPGVAGGQVGAGQPTLLAGVLEMPGVGKGRIGAEDQPTARSDDLGPAHAWIEGQAPRRGLRPARARVRIGDSQAVDARQTQAVPPRQRFRRRHPAAARRKGDRGVAIGGSMRQSSRVEVLRRGNTEASGDGQEQGLHDAAPSSMLSTTASKSGSSPGPGFSMVNMK